MAAAESARDKGFEVVIALVDGEERPADHMRGFKAAPVSSSRMIRDVNALIKAENLDIIHAVTLKYGFLSGMAALPFKTLRKIYTMAGLGYVFRSHTVKARLLRVCLRPFLTLVFRRRDTTLIFQNPDDRDLMVRRRYANREQTVLIRGSGVDLDKFTPRSPHHTEKPPIVLMPARLVREKGISVFIAAARLLKKRGVMARFRIAGGETRHNPHALSRADMLEMTKDGAVEWIGRVDDMPACYAQAALIVYPSWYGEGIPRVLLEACAAGKAIITTDHPGCREAVAHGLNGLLVPVRDPVKTADAIETLLCDSALRAQMEQESRKRAEHMFDIRLIAAQTADVYEHA